MKVLHVVTDTNRRGAQVFACDLSDALGRRGHDSTVVALAPGAVGGLDLPVLSPRRKSMSSFTGIRAAMKEADITVAHGSSTVVVCAVSGLGPGRPFVTRQISETRFWSGTPARRLRVGAYLRLARSVMALAESASTDLQQILRVPRSKIVVIPNGVPAHGFDAPPERTAARAAFGLDPESVVVGYVGALAPEKGVDLAIEAVARRPGTQLLVLGDGPHRTELEALASSRAPGRCTFAGSVSSPVDGFAAMDLVVLPSRGGDSMPAVLIEAGFCGVPAVSTDVGAIPDVVLDGRTGRVVAAGDQDAFSAAVDELLDDDALRSAMGAAARDHCRSRFEIDVVAAQWETALASAAHAT